jgi:hypothetical protein
MFRASSAHFQVDTVVHMQHMLCCIPYAASAQLYPPEDEHLRLETHRGEYYFMNKYS